MESIFIYSFIIIFVWFGFVSAISFMEAPVKFKAPTLSRSAGLDAGRHVFKALNRMEILFAVIILISLFVNENPAANIVFIFIAAILLLQTAWLLPALNKRAISIINEVQLPPSKIHIIYIILETIKLLLLVWLGILQINEFKIFI